MLIQKIDDFHVHLRQDDLSNLVSSNICQSVRSVYVMPNLIPPITLPSQAVEYKAKLQQINPNVEYFMTLYLSSVLTPDLVKEAAEKGIVGIKSYPKGVTTNSSEGIESYTQYYPIFEAMSEHSLVLNLHGEVPSGGSVCIMNAEAAFLCHLEEIHRAFPKLKIVLEHASTRLAVEMVKKLGDTVGCTITLHHLALIVDDWANDCHSYCKPVPKFPDDRAALREVILSGHPRFFLGTDSAPHLVGKKKAGGCAGVFTGSLVGPYLCHLLDSFGAVDRLDAFASVNGRAFYGMKKGEGSIEIEKSDYTVPEIVGGFSGIVPFMAGQTLSYRIKE